MTSLQRAGVVDHGRCVMRIWIGAAALAAGVAAGAPAQAYDGISSEGAHVVGSAVFAGVVTALASDAYPEQRAWIGFGVSAGACVLSELVPLAAGKTTRVRSAALDIGSEVLGAALGAWITDSYILKPVVAKDASGRLVVGAVFGKAF